MTPCQDTKGDDDDDDDVSSFSEVIEPLLSVMAVIAVGGDNTGDAGADWCPKLHLIKALLHNTNVTYRQWLASLLLLLLLLRLGAKASH